MKSKQYDEALQILRTIILKELGASKVVSLLQMVRCEIELGQIQSAINVSDEVMEILNSKLSEIPMQIIGRCNEELKSVIAHFITLEKMDTAFFLLRSHFYLVKAAYKDEFKLQKLKDLGLPLQKVTKKLNCKTNAEDCFKFLDDVLREMQNLHQLDPELKTRVIVSFMKYYGCCCNNLRYYDKSINLFNQAIFFMNSMFGDYAANYQSLGHCHHHLALALEHTVKYEEAKQACGKAMSVYEQANDWENVQQKNNCVTSISRSWNRINIKLESYNLFWKTHISITPAERRKLNAFLAVTSKRPKYPIATPLLKRSQSEGQLHRESSVEF